MYDENNMNGNNYILNKINANREREVISQNRQIVNSHINEENNKRLTVRDTNAIVQDENRNLANTRNGGSVINSQNGQMGYYDQSPMSMNYSSGFNKFELKQKITQELNKKMKNTNNPNSSYLMSVIGTILNTNEYTNLPGVLKEEIIQEIVWDITGYGILQPLLENEEITEIICNNYKNIWVERNGVMEHTDLQFANDDELKRLIDKIIQPLGRRLDDASPYVNARLKDKSRVNAVIEPISADGTTLDIRKFAKKVFTTEDYVDRKSMKRMMAEFIKWLVIYRKNIIVSGGTGSGKTSLLNWASRFIPENEMIITIEDLLELQLVQPGVRSLEARGANPEGKGAVSIRDLVVNALRMRPDRLIIGECRSAEIVDMLQAMNTGHDGSLSTIHANNSKQCISRMTVMYKMAGLDMGDDAIKAQIGSAVHFIVQIARLSRGDKKGLRKMIQVSEIIGYGREGAERNNRFVEKNKLDPRFAIKNISDTEVYIQDIFKYDELNDKFITTGWVPTCLAELRSIGCPFTKEDFARGEIKE